MLNLIKLDNFLGIFMHFEDFQFPGTRNAVVFPEKLYLNCYDLNHQREAYTQKRSEN